MSKKKHRKEIEARPGTGPSGHPPVLRISIILAAVLVAAAYMIRFDSFKKEHPLSFDESVYSILAVQMTNSPGTYNTIAIYEDSLKKGRELPAYFKMPLFKHPPMFPWLIKQSYGIFGANYYAAFRVSLLAGVLLIALAYFLGSALFGERTGIAAALIMFIEPVTWIASQKIWMETTLAFFTVLSLC
ncbi:MAG: glycosyltransferase family 39 protein, partial [Candidatus Omnitrophica bacterium]|nr:glycosyltransferase family 39 protein [Candidatus Omnitrophota bacterium]